MEKNVNVASAKERQFNKSKEKKNESENERARVAHRMHDFHNNTVAIKIKFAAAGIHH